MPPPSGIELQPGAQGLDFANYFVSYGYLYHQKDMLQDRGRMTAYRNAILQNASCFEGKVVLDVGAGSGVLSIWAAMAGAKRVYAVEATSMAQHARRLVQQNGVQDVVVVLEGYMEAQELPEKVDLIVSEWMGYFLLREAMYDSVLAARDKWLKPGGAMYPSHAFLRNEDRLQKLSAKPSEIVRRQLRVTPYPHEDSGWIVSQAGDEVCMFSSDYPHVEGGRHPLKRFDESLQACSSAARQRFYADNFIDLMGAGLAPALRRPAAEPSLVAHS